MILSNNEGGKTRQETEIITLVYLARNEDEAAFIELRSYLDRYIKLFAHKYYIPGCDADEIEQEALYALRYKAIEDFDPERGAFRSFAILCIKRHLFSLIKANNQQKRTVLNQSLSLDEDRSEGGEFLSLANLVTEDGLTAISLTAEEEFERTENHNLKQDKLLEKLSAFEREVLKLYLQQFHYDEIVEELCNIFPDRAAGKISKKSVDNALQRVRQKAQNLAKILDWL